MHGGELLKEVGRRASYEGLWGLSATTLSVLSHAARPGLSTSNLVRFASLMVLWILGFLQQAVVGFRLVLSSGLGMPM